MIGHILTQIWNKRRANAWLMIELVLVTFFLWKAIDPVFVMMSNRAIDKGFDMTNTFCLTMAEYPASHAKYSPEQATDSMRRVNFLRIYNLLRNYKDVTAAVVTINRGYPSSDSYNGTQLAVDSTNYSMQYFSFYSDGDYFGVFNIDGGIEGNPNHRDLTEPSVYLTRNVARNMFGHDGALNRTVASAGKPDNKYRVAGVIDKFKSRSIMQPGEMSFMPTNELQLWGFPYCMQICFRVADGVSPQVFAEGFKQEFAPLMNVGNYHYQTLTSFPAIEAEFEFMYGFTNTMRLQVSMAVFFLLCTFLGVSGAFWMRASARRGEVGLRMALGSTRGGVLKAFFIESWLITTVAWLIGLFVLFQFVFYTGFGTAEYLTGNMEYLHNRPVIHFGIVSLMVYILMVAIALLGTWVPAAKASNIEPAQALRDE
ncbi:ABC transporter permease [Bacteroides sp. OttesenSCG-928-D19]|nr:ABC transporter permease [Bacteroides sp. OttesenSCG-928-D19]